MIIFDLIFGFLLLLAGRNLFWLCIGIIGFLLGVQYAGMLGFSNELTAFAAAIGLGILGVVLAIMFEWAAIIFGVGFLGGGYLLMNIFSTIIQPDSFSWLVFVVGGIVGMCLMIVALDLTLIIISSLLGATLIVNGLQGTETFRDLLFITSVITGIVVQYFTLRTVVEEQHPQHVMDDQEIKV